MEYAILSMKLKKKGKYFQNGNCGCAFFKLKLLNIYENCINFSLEEGRQMKKNVVIL